MTVTLEDLEKRVIALESAQKTNKGTLEWISGTLGKIAATQDNHTARLDKLDNDVQAVKDDIAGLRRDLPSIVAETMREVLKEQRGG